MDARAAAPAGTADENSVPTIDVAGLAALLSAPHPPMLLDVREPAEYDSLRISGAKLIPLGSLPSSYQDLPKDKPIVVYCRTGNRSARAVSFLRQNGFTQVQNLAGGIAAWQAAQNCDPVKRIC